MPPKTKFTLPRNSGRGKDRGIAGTRATSSCVADLEEPESSSNAVLNFGVGTQDERVKQIFVEESYNSSLSLSGPSQKGSKEKKQSHALSDNFHPQASSSRITDKQIERTTRSFRITRSTSKPPVAQHRSSSFSSDRSDISLQRKATALSRVTERKIDERTTRSSRTTRSTSEPPVVRHNSSSSSNSRTDLSLQNKTRTKSSSRVISQSSLENVDNSSDDENSHESSQLQRRQSNRQKAGLSTSSSSNSRGLSLQNKTRTKSSSRLTSRSSLENVDNSSDAENSHESSQLQRSQSTRKKAGPSTSDNRTKSAATVKPKSRKQNKPKKKADNVLKEIKHYQKQVGLLIPRLPFCRVVRQYLLSSYSGDIAQFRISVDALEALQEAAEMFLVQLFEDSYRCTIHRNRVTLMPKDVKLALLLKNLRI